MQRMSTRNISHVTHLHPRSHQRTICVAMEVYFGTVWPSPERGLQIQQQQALRMDNTEDAARGFSSSASANFPPRLEHIVLNLAPFLLAAISLFYLQPHQLTDASEAPGAIRWCKRVRSKAGR